MKNGKLISTHYAGSRQETSETVLCFTENTEQENELFLLFPEYRGQTFEGFGAAATDSAGYIYSMMTAERKKEFIEKYFGREGFHYRYLRMPIDSCDFSLACYEAMGDPADREMKSFSLDRQGRYIFPLVRDIEDFCGQQIPILVTPWSPPAFMKTNGRREGGKLKPEYADFWADYLCRYIIRLREARFPVRSMSIQNEPKAAQIWDSCVFTAAEEKEFLENHLYPALCKNGLDKDMELYVWDHNKERLLERACKLMDAGTEGKITGFAFHWYSGDHFEQLQMVHEKYPDKKLILSEACIEFLKYDAADLRNAEKYAHDIIGNLNHGMQRFYDWNLLLNQQGGPNHVGNFCDAPLKYNASSDVLEEDAAGVYLEHFAGYIMPGAVRIGHSRYTDSIEMTAFRNPDGTLAAVFLNKGNVPVKGFLKLGDYCAEVVFPARSIATAVL